jgi:tetratricopeptide (TPR) repeat protein
MHNSFSSSQVAIVAILFVAQLYGEPQNATVDELYEQAQAAKARGDLTTAIEKYKAMLKLSPDLAAAYNNVGLLYFQTREYTKATQAFEAGLKRDSSMSPSLVLLGLSYFELGDFGRARPVLERAVHAMPDDEQAQLYLGLALAKTGEIEKGATVLQTLLKKNPKHLEALYHLGKIYMTLAQETLQRLETQGPDSYLTHLIAGEAQEQMEHYDAALAQYKQALERQPQGFTGLHYKAGNIYWLEGKWPEAKTEFKLELDSNPKNCMALWKTGNVMLQTKEDLAQASEFVDRALELCPNVPQAILDQARLAAQMGRDDRALELFKRVAQLSPEESSVHYQLARLYRKLGKTEESNAELNIVRELKAKEDNARR